MSIKKTKPALLVALALQQLSSPVFAQTSAPATTIARDTSSNQLADGQPLPEIIVKGQRANSDYAPAVTHVGAKTEQALRDVPQTVNVVNKDLMDAQGATSLADALRNVPGITIGGAEGGQIGNNINLRGFTARTDIYMDGFRDRGQYYRDLFDLEQVEVLQGPSSMLFGRGSTGGVINQETKQAKLGNFATVSGTVGSDGRARTTLDDNTQLSDTSALRVNVFAQNLETTRDVMSNKDFGVAPTLRLGIGQPTEITISALLQHNNDMPDYGVESLNGHPVTASSSTFYGLASDQTNQDIAMLNGVVKHTFNDTFVLRNQTQFNRYTTDAQESAAHALSTTNTAAGVITPPAFGNYNPAKLWVELQSHDRNIVDTSVDNQTDLIAKFVTGTIKHEMIVGAEFGHDTYSNQTLSRTGAGMPAGYVGFVSLMNPSDATPATVTTTNGNLAQSTANTVGIYVNDTISLNEHWKVVTGVRWDRFDAQINNSISLPAHATQDASFTSLREGLIYQPTEEQSYYASYGTSFDPLLEQMTLTNGQQSLPPTNTRSYELGGKWDLLNDKLMVSFAAFNEKQNNVYSVSNGEYQASGNWLIKGATLGAVGHITDQLQISSGYMHLDPKVIDTVDGTAGSTPGNTPKNTFNVWTTYDINKTWQVGGGVFYMSDRFVADSGITSTLPQGNVDRVSVPSYTRWDATVAYHQPKYDIRLNLLNLTNKQYYDALIQSDGGRAVPGIGRTALLTGTYHF
ncbi:TonB-dependent receptor [Solimicrobium silvestre]|uniref:TonB-siderophor: TonB-dependent siderophore receptor n=1 Tax=Solimicrobium silvestre TaxID=2099400 RepID=A0A2S9GZS2_9BURK|nr:TonB-dependent siderophore receptor [Solimicrobium silvestre]PRC93235.1 TonB-siderophor: TonB-dependent siderophore receptor [Solimicrobium silvestre]